MKNRAHVLWVMLLVGTEATASAFWCNGEDRFSDHPLDFDVMATELNLLSSLPEFYQSIRSRFVEHVNDIGKQDEKNVRILLGMFDELLDPTSSSFLRHTHFRWRDAAFRGIEQLDCELNTQEVQAQRPGLSAVYAAIETTSLAGRQARLRGMETDAEVLREN